MKHYCRLMAKLAIYSKVVIHHETIDAIGLVPHVYA